MLSRRRGLTKLILLLVTIAVGSLALFSWQQSIQLELFRSSGSTVPVSSTVTVLNSASTVLNTAAASHQLNSQKLDELRRKNAELETLHSTDQHTIEQHTMLLQKRGERMHNLTHEIGRLNTALQATQLPKGHQQGVEPPTAKRHTYARPHDVEPVTVFSARAAYNLLWSEKTAALGESDRRAAAERAPLLCSHQRMVPSVFMIGGTKTGSTAFFHGVSEVRPLTVSTVPLIAVCPLVGFPTVTLSDSLRHHTTGIPAS